jgi:3-isopropylmalate/(R)-2-methylmalate dehydratase small subunit
MSDMIRGKVFVVGDNIDTDQIIPAHYMTLVPSDPVEYRELGTKALSGLPESYTERFVPDGAEACEYAVVIGGRNFGCGSSREHAPIALGAAGIKAIVAESFARIFFRNCLATGELYPIEVTDRASDLFATGDEVELDIAAGVLRSVDGSKTVNLRPMGETQTVVDAGGLFAYARKTGLVGSE